MQNIRYNSNTNELYIIDQTLLPNEEKEILLSSKEVMYDAIKYLRVRGAPAIGICAAYCLAVLAKKRTENPDVCANSDISQLVEFYLRQLKADADYLNSSRPTAVNLSWALKRQLNKAEELAQEILAADEALYIDGCLSDSVSPIQVSVKTKIHAQSQNASHSLSDSATVTQKNEDTFPCSPATDICNNSDVVLSNAYGKGNFNILTFIADGLVQEAIRIHNEDIAMCEKISEHGLSLLKDGFGLLTHCNAGPLATSKYGTALGPMLLGTERGMTFHVFADETRPLLQGARLTSYELQKAGIDVTLICDNMANTVMKKGLVDAVLVGSDRIAANGDVANKIGTCGVAVLAKYYGIPFYVLAPSSTIDPSCPSGDDIIIEERDPDEIKTLFYEKPMAPAEVKCFNPAFDVTDHSLVTAIITEQGILYPPYDFIE